MSDLHVSMTPGFSMSAMPMIVTEHAVGELVTDWSRCRSPARAKRRERRGFYQHVRRFRKPACYEANGTLYIHPELNAELRKEMKRRVDRKIDNDLMAAFTGGATGLALSRLGYRFAHPPSFPSTALEPSHAGDQRNDELDR